MTLSARLTSIPAVALLSALCAAPAAHAQAFDANLAHWTGTGTVGTLGANGDITLSPLGSPAYGFVTTAGSSAVNVSPLSLSESGGNGSTFTQTNGSSYLSPVFSTSGAQPFSASFNYVSTDGKGFDDYAWARLVNVDTQASTWLFTARSTNSNKQSIVPGDLGVGFDPAAVIRNYSSFDFNTRNTTPGGTPINWSPLGDSNGTCWRDKAEGCGFTGWLQSEVTLAAGQYRFEVGVVNFGDQLYDSGLAFDVAGLTSPVPEPGTLPMMAAGLFAVAAWGRRRKARTA